MPDDENELDLTKLNTEELDAFAAIAHFQTEGVEIVDAAVDFNPPHGSNSDDEMEV